MEVARRLIASSKAIVARRVVSELQDKAKDAYDFIWQMANVEEVKDAESGDAEMTKALAALTKEARSAIPTLAAFVSDMLLKYSFICDSPQTVTSADSTDRFDDDDHDDDDDDDDEHWLPFD